jgi:hypothetical protein
LAAAAEDGALEAVGHWMTVGEYHGDLGEFARIVTERLAVTPECAEALQIAVEATIIAAETQAEYDALREAEDNEEAEDD